jgi:hypothetical protein
MALTYRKAKGSALTIDELDDNFRYFTGSHSITGSLIVAGNIVPGESTNTLGTADNPWKTLYVDNGTIYFMSGSSSGSMSWNSSSGFELGPTTLSGSNTIDGSLTITGSVTISGSNTLTNVGPFNNTGSVYVTGNVTSTDVNIDNWGSVSASLASISTPDIQAVTLAGNEFTGGLSIINDTFGTESNSPYNGSGLRFRARPDRHNFTSSLNIDNGGNLIVTSNSSVRARFGSELSDVGVESIGTLYGLNGAILTGSLTVSGSDPGMLGNPLSTIKFENLPTDESTVSSGQLWLSGSVGTSSKLLCVKD